MVFDVFFSDKMNMRFDFVYEKEADCLRTKKNVLPDNASIQQALFGDKFQYLSASRIDPKVIHDKSYTSVVNLHNIGKHGQYTAHFLHVFGNNDIAFPNLKHSKSKTLRLIDQVNCWMGEISIGVKFNTTDIPNTDNILLDMQFEQPN